MFSWEIRFSPINSVLWASLLGISGGLGISRGLIDLEEMFDRLAVRSLRVLG